MIALWVFPIVYVLTNSHELKIVLSYLDPSIMVYLSLLLVLLTYFIVRGIQKGFTSPKDTFLF